MIYSPILISCGRYCASCVCFSSVYIFVLATHSDIPGDIYSLQQFFALPQMPSIKSAISENVKALSFHTCCTWVKNWRDTPSACLTGTIDAGRNGSLNSVCAKPTTHHPGSDGLSKRGRPCSSVTIVPFGYSPDRRAARKIFRAWY